MARAIVGQVEEGLVAGRGDEVRIEEAEGRARKLRELEVLGKVDRNETEAHAGGSAQPLCDEAGHGGAHAVAASGVARRRDHAGAAHREDDVAT